MREDRVLTVRPRRPSDPQVDLRLYTVAHRAIQHGAHELADLAERLHSGDVELTVRRATALDTYTGLFVADVRHHHHYEDQIGFPVVRASALGAVDIEPLSVDHDRLEPVLEAFRGAVVALRGGPAGSADQAGEAGQADQVARKALAVEAVRLRDLLDEHIAEEERDIFPAIAQYVSVEDFGRWERAATKGYPIRNLWFTVSRYAAVVPPAELSSTMARTPPAHRWALRLFRRRYGRLHEALFG
ncbi:hemerythrin domain-containing protein [Spirillospora sp. NPDC047279]|uniref:hemerythrin domain-containing protein n=1 Tax=Spirillospora sp. NPDC047279 TaxID=3155478 RepID=UPI0033D82943